MIRLVLAFVAGYIIGGVTMFVYFAEKIGPAIEAIAERNRFDRKRYFRHDL
jgi:predicted membrane-bound dolichyl-phosphate-mannose-protein mannosyltransferase